MIRDHLDGHLGNGGKLVLLFDVEGMLAEEAYNTESDKLDQVAGVRAYLQLDNAPYAEVTRLTDQEPKVLITRKSSVAASVFVDMVAKITRASTVLNRNWDPPKPA